MDIFSLAENEIIIGRKTFFIALDPSLMPRTFLEEFLSHGYETYLVEDDDSCPIAKKVELLVSLFADAIFFFYIDARIEDVDWKPYIMDVQRKYGDSISVGVLYSRRGDDAKEALERYYLGDVGVECGCIPLDDSVRRNFDIVDSVLFTNQASGRRRTVRAFCPPQSQASFDFGGGHFVGQVTDISVDHFSCHFERMPSTLPLYEKILGVRLELDGLELDVDCVLISHRNSSRGVLHIFMFTQGDGTQGLPRQKAEVLLSKLYQMVTERVKTLMSRVFSAAGRQLRAQTPYL